MLWPDLQLSARFKASWPVLKQAVCLAGMCMCTYGRSAVRHQAAHVYVYLHVLVLISHSDPRASTSSPTAIAVDVKLGQVPDSRTCIHTCILATTAAVFLPYLLKTFAACLVPMPCTCSRAWQSLAIQAGSRFIPSYQASHCFGPASYKAGRVANWDYPL